MLEPRKGLQPLDACQQSLDPLDHRLSPLLCASLGRSLCGRSRRRSQGESSLPAGGEWQPVIDMVETPTSVTILAELPGLSASDLQVTVRGTLVTLSGTKSTPRPGAQRRTLDGSAPTRAGRTIAARRIRATRRAGA